MKHLFFVLTLVALSLLVAGCGGDIAPDPVGVGSDASRLQKSPCACLEIQQDYSDWMKGSV